MIETLFSIRFDFVFDISPRTIPLTAWVEWQPAISAYHVDRFTMAHQKEGSILPAIQIRQVDGQWVHMDSEKSTALSLAVGSKIEEYNWQTPYPTHHTIQLLSGYLKDAIQLDHADFGNIQLLDSGTNTLHIMVQSGFKPDFLEYFRAVKQEDSSACGKALKTGNAVVIYDVMEDHDFAPHRSVALKAGFRSVNSIPLFNTRASSLGVLSLHSKIPRQDWTINRKTGIIAALEMFLDKAAV